MRKYLLFFFLLFCLNFPKNIFAQTSEIENYQVYTRESGSSSLGYLRLKFDLNPAIGITIVNHGLSYNHYYDISMIGNVPIDDNNLFSIYLAGASKIGIAAADENLILNSIFQKKLIYYAFMADFYSLSLVPEYTRVLENGYALTAKFAYNFLNIGITAAFPKGGVFNQNFVGMANILPLAFIPSVYVDFGRSGLGLSFYINPVNILSYNFIPNATYGADPNSQKSYFDQSLRGVKFFSSAFQRYDLQIMFTF